MKAGPHPVLAHGKVRYVGDHVAVVIAETCAQAKDGRGSGRCRLRACCPPSSMPAQAQERRKARSMTWRPTTRSSTGISATRRRPMPPSAKAEHVTKLDLVNNRLIPNAMEPRAAIGSYDTGDEALHALHDEPESARGAPRHLGLHRHCARTQAARHRAGCRRRLRLEDLHLCRGGGLPLGVEARVGRPVKWTRRPHGSLPLPIAHGRDHVTHAELAHRRRTARSWRCGSRPSPIWAPISRPSRPPCRPISMRRCCRASTTSRRSIARWTRSTPTPRRLTPIAAPGGRRRPIVVERLVETAAREIEDGSGGVPPAQLHHVVPAPDAGHHGLRRRRLSCLAQQGAGACRLQELPGAQGAIARRAASCAASAFRPISRPAASRRRRRSARSAPASACGNRPRCGSIRSARSKC